MSHVRHRGRRRARTRIACALALGATVGLAGPAGAQEGPAIPDPQTTNIPYTAWAGTQLRLVKCDDELQGIGDAGLEPFVESWSGAAQYTPRVIESSVTKIGGRDSRCARFNVVTLGDGLARIKLKAFTDDRVPVEILEHQFLAAWLRIDSAEIDEVGAGDPTGGPAGSESEVGDPAGDGQFLPSSRNGRVQVMVTGSFPHPAGPGGRFTLPDDWAAMAAMLATDADASTEDDSMRWDIHDDQLETEGHVPGACAPVTPTPIDAVDNCRGGLRFSRFFGDLTSAGPGSWGPFDPLRLNSLMSDGKLDAGDAPMPAARVDFAIAPNTGGTDIGGAGALEAASKREVYSRDGNGTDTPHNLYAPYYTQWIPAASAEEANRNASGTDWYAQNNFGGLEQFGAYENWDTFSLNEHDTMETACNRTVAFPGGASADEPRTTPRGDRRVAVFTDEHGEAQVEFEPYAGGFYYDSLAARDPDILNDNRGCDLDEVDTLGTASIAATVRYPGQPVDFPPVRSASVVKTIGNEFDKSMRYYPKGTGAANANANIVVVHGQDVDGTPFAGERVCFYVDDKADSYRLFSGLTGPAASRFRVTSAQAPTPSVIHPDVLCAFLDANGNAALEVFNSGDQTINVIAEYIDEGLLRDLDVIFGAGDGPGDPPSEEPPPNTDPDNGGGGGGVTTPPTVKTIVKTVGTGDVGRLAGGAKGATKTSSRIHRAKVVKTKKGRYLVVKITSTAKRVKIVVRLKMRSGKVRRISRTVATNRNVRVMRLSKAVKSVKVSLAK